MAMVDVVYLLPVGGPVAQASWLGPKVSGRLELLCVRRVNQVNPLMALPWWQHCKHFPWYCYYCYSLKVWWCNCCLCFLFLPLFWIWPCRVFYVVNPSSSFYTWCSVCYHIFIPHFPLDISMTMITLPMWMFISTDFLSYRKFHMTWIYFLCKHLDRCNCSQRMICSFYWMVCKSTEVFCRHFQIRWCCTR